MRRGGGRLHIDWTACDGRGLCVELLPEVLAADDWGYPVARDGTPAPWIPADLLSSARAAERFCPRLALRLVPERPPAAAAGERRAENTTGGPRLRTRTGRRP